jgi:serine protease
MFRQLFAGPLGSKIVWTVSAGNSCADTPFSAWAANADLANVLSVAASNSDGTLASFSNFGVGVEIAAPGGVSVPDGTVGGCSTSTKGCDVKRTTTCRGYEAMSGTSMERLESPPLWTTDENQIPGSVLARSQSSISKPELTSAGVACTARAVFAMPTRAAAGRACLGRLACRVGAGD